MVTLKESQCPIDILRMIYNKWQTLSIIVLVNGHGQIGKSTFISWIANRLCQLRDHVPVKRATWKEWDWQKFTTTSPKQFVKLWDENDGQVLAMEEAGEQMNYLEFWGVMSRVFSSMTRTQGLKRNCCFLITPFSKDITKYNREHVDFRIWVRKRNDKLKYVRITPRYVKINYLKDSYRLGYIHDWHIFYPERFLIQAKAFTDHLKGYKKDIIELNKERVGLKKTKYQQFVEECKAIGVRPPSISTAEKLGIV